MKSAKGLYRDGDITKIEYLVFLDQVEDEYLKVVERMETEELSVIIQDMVINGS